MRISDVCHGGGFFPSEFHHIFGIFMSERLEYFTSGNILKAFSISYRVKRIRGYVYYMYGYQSLYDNLLLKKYCRFSKKKVCSANTDNHNLKIKYNENTFLNVCSISAI